MSIEGTWYLSVGDIPADPVPVVLNPDGIASWEVPQARTDRYGHQDGKLIIVQGRLQRMVFDLADENATCLTGRIEYKRPPSDEDEEETVYFDQATLMRDV